MGEGDGRAMGGARVMVRRTEEGARSTVYGVGKGVAARMRRVPGRWV